MRIGVMSAGITGAAGHDALSMVLHMREAGEDAILFTDAARASNHASAYDLADAPLLLSAGDLLIYHFTGPDETAERILQRLSCEIVLRPHTLGERRIDPAKSVAAARRQREIRAGLARLRDRRLLEAWLPAGIDADDADKVLRLPCRRVPQFIETEALLKASPSTAVREALSKHWLNVLIVSPLAADTGIEEGLRTFSALSRVAIPKAHLHIVGDAGGDEEYLDRLGSLAGTHELDGAFTHHLDPSPATVAALYRSCDMMLATPGTTAEAITQALAFGLPIIGLASQAAANIAVNAAMLASTPDKLADAAEKLAFDAFEMASARRTALQRFNDHCQSRHTAGAVLAALTATRRKLREPLPVQPEIDDDWFGIPHAEELVRAIIAAAPDMRGHSLDGEDRRLDLIAWAISAGRGQSDDIRAIVEGDDFTSYAAHIPVPPAASHLTGDQRLRWFFDREVRSAFDLCSMASVSAFLEWSQGQAAA